MDRIEEAIVNWWGKRCPDHEDGCPICDSWAEYDALTAELDRLREILSFDCTSFPGMEEAAVKWADKISGPRGGKPYHPDPIAVLEMCEEIAKAAIEDGDHGNG